jgi:hypothetical protein
MIELALEELYYLLAYLLTEWVGLLVLLCLALLPDAVRMGLYETWLRWLQIILYYYYNT